MVIRQFLLWLTCLIVLPCAAFGQAIDTQNVESRALAARNGIRNGFIHLEASTKTDTPAFENQKRRIQEYQSEYKFWFTPDRIRLDLLLQELTSKILAERQIECVNYDGKGRDFVHRGDIKTVAEQGKGMHANKRLHQVFDPRTIGYSTSDLNSLRQRPKMGKFGYRKVIRESIKSEKVLFDGLEMILISWDESTTAIVKPPGSLPMHCNVWISPSEGYNVRRAATWENNRSGKEEWRGEIHTTLKNYDGTWFLSGYSLKRTHLDGETSSETVKVIDAWFNRIDPLDAFELKSFGLQPGQGIYDNDTKERIVFDADNVRVNVDEELAKAASNATPLAPIPGTINYWLVAVCVGAAGVGAFLIFRLLQKGRANAGS